jgi:hypothetical protein
VEGDKTGDESAIPSTTLVTVGGVALSDSGKAQALADIIEAHFQPVDDPSDPAVLEMIDEALQAYSFAPASEPKLTNHADVQDAIRGLMFGNAAGPNGIPNRALKYLCSELYSS